METKLTFYKVIKDNEAKDGGHFNYSNYLPKGSHKGKWVPRLKNLISCKKGYHVTPYWNMFFNSGCTIYKVEVKGMLKNSDTGVKDKYVCETIRLVKKFVPPMVNKNNTGDSNTGHSNTGDSNTGHRNTGHGNTGDSNTGHGNTGHSNTGDRNAGNENTGHRNTGYWNTGDSNTGHRNAGHGNTGDSNTGDWNAGNENTGHFNTTTPENITVFNKKCARKIWDKVRKPNFIYFNVKDDNYKKSFQNSFNETTNGDVKLLLKLPNFDYKVFEKISGISEKMIDIRLKG